MHSAAQNAPAADKLAAAFEHSITWEDDIWRADPVDVEAVHAKARRKFYDLLEAVTEGRASGRQARILLFHGQSGAGKTHLIRALRTGAHRRSKAYFGYAQMTPDVSGYADYFLRRLVASLEKPYSPDVGGESGLARLTRRLVTEANTVSPEVLEQLREAALDERQLAKLVHTLSDDIIASPRFTDQGLDANVIRALLYLQRSDPRVDQRVRQYLQGRQLNELSQAAVGALDPNNGDGRAFEIIEALGRMMWAVDGAALAFCIDQVEDLRFFDDPEERFQRAIKDLNQIANRVPTSIVVISCLEDFYGQVRSVLTQSYIDRIEKSGPVALLESRTPDEARQIIAKRLEHAARAHADGASFPDASAFFGPQFFEEFGGLSTRRLLEHAQSRLRAKEAEDEPAPVVAEEKAGFISTLAAALGFAADNDEPAKQEPARLEVDYREMWERFASASEAEMPADDHELMDVLAASLNLATEEWGGAVQVTIERLELADDVPVVDLAVRHRSGHAIDARVFLCNRPTQGGGLKRQLDRVLTAMSNRACFMLRASDFPPNRKNQTAQAFRKFRDGGGRSLLVPIPEWERMMTVREFHAHHRSDPGFGGWFEQARLLSGLVTIVSLLRLDLLGRSPGRIEPAGFEQARAILARAANAAADPMPAVTVADAGARVPVPAAPEFSSWGPGAVEPIQAPANDDELPLSVILNEGGDNVNSITAGRPHGGRGKPITLNKGILKRHAAVLGGSGSGKTTLALNLIEQLLLRGIPAVLIDRKGDLASYANPDVWRANENEYQERRGDREKLADAIDVAVYTPGRSSGRPISITLLPTGISELPEHEQQLLANLSSAALGDMLHLKNSATHQKQSGTLSVALKILGSRSRSEVTLADLIHLLEDEDPELTDLTQRMDPSGKIRRDLVAQLDSLRHRNSVMFEGGGESIAAVLGGHIMAMVESPAWAPMVASGQFRLLMVLNGERSKKWPETPTLKELGYTYEFDSPFGLAGPKGMDPKVVKKLHDAFKKAYDEPKVAELFEKFDFTRRYMNTADYQAFIPKLAKEEKAALVKLGLAK